MKPPEGRGGPQRIPRPAGAEMGGPPPWAELASCARRVTIAGIEEALSSRGAAGQVGDAPAGASQSAVLVVLYEDDGEVHVVLTRRSPRMRHHAHEVSFPGGRRDTDDPDLWHTAVREATEEIGIDPTGLRRIGELDSFMTVGSLTLVHPFVAVTSRRPDLTASPDEVESILHVPLSELLLDEVWREEVWPIALVGRRAITFFELVGDTVWGATGAMLRQLLAIATGTDDRILGGPA